MDQTAGRLRRTAYGRTDGENPMSNEHTTNALMTSFMTGVCLTICIGAIFKTEDIQTLEDARRVYGLIAITP